MINSVGDLGLVNDIDQTRALPTSQCYILLPVHNRLKLTEQFIADLQQQTFPDVHLLLIDDGSHDGTAEMVQARLSRLTVIRGKGDWWWAGSLQQGINWLKQHEPAPADIILIINDDVRIAPTFLETGIKLLTTMPDTLLQAEGEEFVARGVTADLEQLRFEPATDPSQINCLTTRGLFLRWQDLVRIGDFHPRLLPHALSDFEFTIRAHRRNLQLRTHPDLKLRMNTAVLDTKPDSAQPSQPTLKSLWQTYFSRRSTSNKIDWSMFILLACPKPYWLPHLYRVWLGGLGKISVSKIRRRR
jgi:glycosyltransferase involved in cell wall biosynthesis